MEIINNLAVRERVCVLVTRIQDYRVSWRRVYFRLHAGELWQSDADDP